jgi:hypothetical protein
LGNPNIDYRLDLTAPATHFSSVIYIVKYVLKTGSAKAVQVKEYAPTKPLPAGQTESMKVHVPTPGVRIFAEGVPGGCNKGTLASWGVTAFVGPGVF